MSHKNMACGERHWNNKLTTEQVLNIKKMLAEGHTQQSIAANYNVSRALIGLIAQGRRWAGVGD